MKLVCSCRHNYNYTGWSANIRPYEIIFVISLVFHAVFFFLVLTQRFKTLFSKLFCPCVFVSRWVNYQRIRRRSWKGKPNGSSVCWTRGCWICRGWRSWMEFCRRTLLETHERSGGSARTARTTTDTHKVRCIYINWLQHELNCSEAFF